MKPKENQIYYLKKYQKLMNTSKPAGTKAMVECITGTGLVCGFYPDYGEESIFNCMEHEFFKIFSKKDTLTK